MARGGTMKHCKFFSVLALAALTLSACAPAKQSSSTDLAAGIESSENIVGGTAVKATDAVAQSTVAILIRSSFGDGVCTGTLIAPNIVLTAAHCTDDLQAALIVFGNNVETSKEARPVDLVAVHPEYAPRAPGAGGWNDLALMRIKGAAPAGAKVASILEDATVLRKGISAVTAGFGSTAAHGRGTDSGVLRKVPLNLQNPAYEKTELLFPLTSRGGSTCHGDSGGPAYLTLKGKLTVIGITSRGTGADCANVSIFTSVASHAAYIKTTAQALQAEPAQE